MQQETKTPRGIHVRAPRVEGVCPVVETPFSRSGEVDGGSLAELVERLGHAGVRSVMYPGFASESIKLSASERDSMLSTVIDRAHRQDMIVVASVSDHATRLAATSAARAVEQGADMISILPPFQLSPSASAVHHHVRAVLDEVPTTPALVQVAPAQTGTMLDAHALAALAVRSPNLVQVKVESTPPGRLISAIQVSESGLTSVVGYAGVQLPDALTRGAVAVQPGCSFVELYLKFWALWHGGDPEAARSIHRRMLPYVSYWMQGVELIVAAEKRISYLRGWIPTDTCRQPGYELDRIEIDMIDAFLDEFRVELNETAPPTERLDR